MKCAIEMSRKKVDWKNLSCFKLSQNKTVFINNSYCIEKGKSHKHLLKAQDERIKMQNINILLGVSKRERIEKYMAFTLDSLRLVEKVPNQKSQI
jgi:hypothetical protein